MKLFAYYACHTFVNQLKKLFKTWMLIFFLVCGLVGGLIGMGAASLGNAAEQKNPQQIEEPSVPLDEKLGISNAQTAELVAGGIVLAVIVYGALSADKDGSKIFLPADVNLLFSSPLKPQSVLMFRLATRMGAGILGCIWLLIEIPALMEMGATRWAAIAGIVAWGLSFAIMSMVQALLYTICSTHVGMKKYIRQGVYGFLALAGAAYFIYWKSTDLTWVQALAAFFNHPASRYVPLWGWVKGFFAFAMEENLTGALLSLAAVIVGTVGLCYWIFHLKADFYEDALVKSQDIANLMEAAQSEKTVIRRRKKDRSDKLLRDGMGHGWGANVFFVRNMYNRFRFAHFHVFTKTSETYLAAAVGMACIFRFVVQKPGLTPVCLALGALAFFRALGNTLGEDTDCDFFRMIPESTWAKLFWSLLGGTVNCMLDLIPGMVAATLILWENPITVLAWLPVIVSVDFFSSTVSAFINLSVPVSAGKLIKQLTMIMFVYFGILPDVAIIAAAMVFDHLVIGAVSAAILNMALGFGFLALLPLFIEPKDGKQPERKKEFMGDLKTIRKQFSKMGLAIFLFLLVSSIFQLGSGILFPQLAEHPVGMWLVNFGPIYVFGFPACLLALKTVESKPVPQKSMKASKWFLLFAIGVFMMIAGNLIGTIVLGGITAIFHVTASNPLETLVVHQLLIPKILVVVVLAPIVEEYIFRKQLIDRMHVYGGKVAVIATAFLFGLFHGNLSQFFYAFGLGLIFGYVYLHTGKLRYSVIMHMAINFMGSVIGPFILEHLDMTVENPLELMSDPQMASWVVALGGLVAVQYVVAIVGLVLLCTHVRKTSFPEEPMELPKGTAFKTVFLNIGMILLFLACLGLTSLTFIV